jgi:TPP-dependent 2-oxoacid decarboxylase
MAATAPSIPLGQYLFRRIAELGVEHVIGVPGDFNRQLITSTWSDPVEECEG